MFPAPDTIPYWVFTNTDSIAIDTINNYKLSQSNYRIKDAEGSLFFVQKK